MKTTARPRNSLRLSSVHPSYRSGTFVHSSIEFAARSSEIASRATLSATT
jgi:hypothetical protein